MAKNTKSATLAVPLKLQGKSVFQAGTFWGALLEEANFDQADLRGANFTNANSKLAKFTGAKSTAPMSAPLIVAPVKSARPQINLGQVIGGGLNDNYEITARDSAERVFVAAFARMRVFRPLPHSGECGYSRIAHDYIDH